MKNCSEADYMKHVKRITEGELWGIVETRNLMSHLRPVQCHLYLCFDVDPAPHGFLI